MGEAGRHGETALMAAKGTALITGGAKRIGREIALRLAAEGYDIALHYNTSQAEAEKTANDIRAKNVACTLFKAELSDESQVQKLAHDVGVNFGDWKLLVNSASMFERATKEEATKSDHDRHMMVNYTAPKLLSEAFAKHVKHGVIVNMLDTFITKESHNFHAYLESKKALADYTKEAAIRLAPSIRVNAVCPGTVLESSYHDAEYLKQKAARMPMKRLASVAEVAEAVAVLVKHEFMIGQFLFVDGGESLHSPR